jgi:hypothetical protein
MSNSRIILICLFAVLVAAQGAHAATTEVIITRLALDEITVLEQRTVDYTWMEANLPVYGDGVTHYYHQGPVFVDDPDPEVEEQLRWNPEEDTNVLEKDMGAVKGSNVRDLCDLVGGMSPGEEVKFIASDGWSRYIAYENIYDYSSCEGPIVLTWWLADQGYVSGGYHEGMRMVWFADDTTNPFGVHAFGNLDWHEAADEHYWYYYYGSPNEVYPTTTGLSGKHIDEIVIYSDDVPTGSINVSSSPGRAHVFIDDGDSGYETNCTISDLEEGTYSVRVEKDGYETPLAMDVEVEHNEPAEVHFDLVALEGTLTINSVPTGAKIILDGVDTGMETDATLDEIPSGSYTITLCKDGYDNATESVIVVGEEDTEVFIELIPLAGDGGDSGSIKSGFNGKSLSNFKRGSLNGTVSIFGSTGGALIQKEGSSTEYVIPVAIPANTTTSLARLYIYATDGKGQSDEGLKPSFSVRFDGEEIFPDRTYTDINGSLSDGSIVATYCYDVTSILEISDNYTVDVTLKGPKGIECLLYGAVLIGVFEGESLPSVTYWIDEGCDVILADSDEGISQKECISTAPFEGKIEPALITNATLMLLWTSPGEEGSASHSVAMNDWEWENPLIISGDDIGIFEQDVKPFLKSLENKASMHSKGPQGNVLEYRSAILLLEHQSSVFGATDSESEIAPAVAPSSGDAGELQTKARLMYPLADEQFTGNCTHILLKFGNISLYIPRETRVLDGDGNAINNITMHYISSGTDDSCSSFAIEPMETFSDIPIILSATLDNIPKSDAERNIAFAHINTTGELDSIPSFIDPESGVLYCQISRFGEYIIHNEPLLETSKTVTFSPFQAFFAILTDLFQILLGSNDRIESPSFSLPEGKNICILQGIDTNSQQSAVQQAEGPFDLTVHSIPPGALITLNGTYTGKVTPYTFSSLPKGPYDLNLKMDEFATFEQEIQLSSDLALCEELYAPGHSALHKLKFGNPADWPDLLDTGGIYVTSRPDGATLYVDGRETCYRTPRVISGLKEGKHSIKVKKIEKDGSSFTSDPKAVWISPGVISSCSIDSLEWILEHDISVVSDSFNGASFTIDGDLRIYTIPEDITIAGSSPSINILDEDRFYSFSYFGVSDGSTIRIEYDDTLFADVMVESDPAGAEIFIDGFKTGLCTPYLIKNVSEGYHHILVSRPGYLPAEEKLHVTDNRLNGYDKLVQLQLESYPYGSLNVTSSPGGAKIYLYNRYTGLTTPYTFTYMGIGTYKIKVHNDEVSAERDDILIEPYNVTRCHFNLENG